MAYTKIVLATEVLASELPDDPYLANRLINYFPTALRERYADAIKEHRLSREIITTVVVNRFVNASGITCFHRLSTETGAGAADVIRAHIAAREIFGAHAHEARIVELDHKIDASMQTALRIEIRTLTERATRWLVNNRRRPVDITSAVDQFRDGVRAVQEALPELMTGRDREHYDKRLKAYQAAGVPEGSGQCHRGAAVGLRCADHRADRGGRPARRPGGRRRPLRAGPSIWDWTGCWPGSSNCHATTAGRRWRAPLCATTCTRCAFPTGRRSAGHDRRGRERPRNRWPCGRRPPRRCRTRSARCG